jgi:2-keto-4-pentenoate hydratase/2-oxohepta-3-ene-1,7-dioic acid hydratase in catechol pathway
MKLICSTDPKALELPLAVNGEERQCGCVAQMIFDLRNRSVAVPES